MSKNDTIVAEFRANNGTVTTGGFGRHLILVHHIGNKTGTERVTPLFAMRKDQDTWVMVATKAGAPTDPDWLHNLRAFPEVTIETPDDGTVPVRAEEITGPERDAIWAHLTQLVPLLGEYQAKTTRVIPVIALHRR
ncbi:nitroreductase/quinone reductase family protein [Smaragdicoccus niigatensis]|uniref:nitroreductase/quinone reductase family protein n=1 Tax=Smaragdicoccus niigatensis TaxID=359359 RepID=UPI00037BB129|nr:nitroreductase/quinone reductase family protein [Smaragdicoccus niigatensis]